MSRGILLHSGVVLALLFQLVCLIQGDTNDTSNSNGCRESANEVSFMNKCFCKPGWVSSVERPGLKCDVPLHHIGDCVCGKKVNDSNVITSDPAEHNAYLDTVEVFDSDRGIRCYNLCRSTPEVGVPISHPSEWKDNLFWKQIGFYTKELRICSLGLRHSHMRERLDEFTQSYGHFEFLNQYTSLGKVIEYGAGGYTQTRNLLERHNISVESVTLVDPLITQYSKLVGCSYVFDGGSVDSESSIKASKCWKSNTFVEKAMNKLSCGIPAKLMVNGTEYSAMTHNSSVEAFGEYMLGADVLQHKHLTYVPPSSSKHNEAAINLNAVDHLYDTVIVMNVLVYSRNAFQFLETIYRTLKPGGLLIFHDRYFDDIVKSSQCKMAGFLTHMIQLRSSFIEYFLSDEFFENLPYKNTEQNIHQKRRNREWCPGHDDERGTFVALRKK